MRLRGDLINLLNIINDECTQGRLTFQLGSLIDKQLRAARKTVIDTRPEDVRDSEAAMEDAKIGA